MFVINIWVLKEDWGDADIIRFPLIQPPSWCSSCGRSSTLREDDLLFVSECGRESKRSRSEPTGLLWNIPMSQKLPVWSSPWNLGSDSSDSPLQGGRPTSRRSAGGGYLLRAFQRRWKLEWVFDSWCLLSISWQGALRSSTCRRSSSSCRIWSSGTQGDVWSQTSSAWEQVEVWQSCGTMLTSDLSVSFTGSRIWGCIRKVWGFLQQESIWIP